MQKVSASFIFGFLAGVMVTFLFLMFTLPSFKHSKQEEGQGALQRTLAERRRTTDSIIYLKDERTGLCYAYCCGGSTYGGPSIACVPCEKVEHLVLKPEE